MSLKNHLLLLIGVILAVICSSDITVYVPEKIENYKGAVVFKKTIDSVGSITIIRYDVIDTLGNYEKFSVNADDDLYNVGEIIK